MSTSVRLVIWTLATALVALPVVGVLCGWFAVNRWPVTQLIVQAPFRHVGVEQLRALIWPYLGRGFLALNLDQVEHVVAALPWVASVEVSRRWPDTLFLRVHERMPVARWNNAQLVSRHGVLFSVPHVARYSWLPNLCGPEGDMSDVFDFYLHARHVLLGTPLKLVGLGLSDRGSWTLRTASGARIMLGERKLAAARLHRFVGVYAQVSAGHRVRFVYADLRYTNGFAMKWLPVAPVSAGHPHSQTRFP